MHSDPIADLLTRINNGLHMRAKSVRAPYSKVKEQIVRLLASEGFLEGSRALKQGNKGEIEIDLKYTGKGESVIKKLRRVSKPSLRVYARVDDLTPFRSGLGVRLITTSKGLMTDTEARKQRLGGEVVCEIY